MTVSPPGHWLLNRMVFLLNRTLGIINKSVFDSIKNLLKDANTFTGINTFMGGINVDNIDSINGNTTFNSEIIVNSNITANNGSFIGDNLVINNIEKNTNSNVTFQSNINMSNNDIDNINSLKSEYLYINNIDINTDSFISVNNEILFNKGVQIDGDLSINGSTITVNTETLTVNDRFIVLNANIESSGKVYTDPAGFIVKTHNASALKNEGYFFWSLETPDGELNRTWDLSGDNLRGNVLKATTLRGNIIDSYYSPNISVISDIDMNNKDITNITSLSSSALTATDLNIDIIKTNTAANISVFNTIDMNDNYIINANIAALNHSQINVENGLINARNLTLGGFNADQTNGVTFRSWHGLNPLENTKVVLHPSDTLYLPENNGVPFGSNNSNHTQSIIGISGLYKIQNNTQQLLNTQCYLIPPSMVSNESDLQGSTLFKTIGEQNESIRYLAGYPTANIGINELKNTLVPTVGQIVDLLNYLGLGVHMNGNQNNLKSSY